MIISKIVKVKTRKKMQLFAVISLLVSMTEISYGALLSPVQKKIIQSAQDILESAKISYVYGGNRIGGESECSSCNACLAENKPAPKLRFKVCKECYACSLDCSHFVHRVYSDAGIHFPYFTTDVMRATPPPKLRKRYGFIDLGRDISRAQPGDLLVYKGHVVMLETLHKSGIGDIVHATGGRAIKGPGAGIQRERRASLPNFAGRLQRILRHERLYNVRLRKIKAVSRKNSY